MNRLVDDVNMHFVKKSPPALLRGFTFEKSEENATKTRIDLTA